MSKRIIISESQFIRLMNEESILDELDYNTFRGDESLEDLRKAINTNKVVSVAYVKKDGSVRHMAIKKYLSAYKPSEKEKTEKQLNIKQNNDIERVIDINIYKKKLKEYGNNKELAAKESWRIVNLNNVLGFLVGGKFIDLREENEIMQRFGQAIYDQLTSGMKKAMEQENNNVEQELGEEWL